MFIAEREGFEPPEPLSSTVFKTAAIDHSAISPVVSNVLQSFCSQLRCKGKDYFRICKFLKHIFLIFSLSFIIHAWK